MADSGKQRGLDLTFVNVSCSVGGRQILHNISGMVKQGEMLAVMGSSGERKHAKSL